MGIAYLHITRAYRQDVMAFIDFIEALERRSKSVAIVALAPAKIAAVGALAVCLATGCAWAQAGPAKAGTVVTLETLLEETVNRERVARWPDPFYLCKQFSSNELHERKNDWLAKKPDDPMAWFHGRDDGYVLRTETNAGRKEWVLMDHSGPGCIARIWAPDRRTLEPEHQAQVGPEDATVRFYFDGASEPGLEAHFLDFLSGKVLAEPPFAYTSPRSGVLYLPIPFAKECKVTLDRKPYYYIITYRAYEKETNVQTFSKEHFDKAKAIVESVGKTLLAAPAFLGGKTVAIEERIAPGGSKSVALPAGPAAVRGLRVTLEPRDEQALRSTVLVMDVDGETTVWCPVADFFGSGVGLNPFKGWYRTVEKDGAMTSRWVMPYRKSATVRVQNLGKTPVAVTLSATVGPWTWDDRSMVFHANWRQQYPLGIVPAIDWNYVEVHGQGVYVGDTLAVMNPVAQWWGEGDEKIRVDGEAFPSIFGTGTEDYYGYSYGGMSNDVYAWPFHAQVRCGSRTFGHNTQTRTRALDAIPFTKYLNLDMEVYGRDAEEAMAYAVATYWYARPGATSNRGPQPAEAARTVPAPPDN